MLLTISILILLVILTLYFSYQEKDKNKISNLLRSLDSTDNNQKTFLTIDSKGYIGNSTLGVPIGTIVMFNGTAVPDGWALCNGENKTPDLRGRFVLGAGKGLDLKNRVMNEFGGKETITLTENELPEHNHNLIDSSKSSILPPLTSVQKYIEFSTTSSSLYGFNLQSASNYNSIKDIKLTTTGKGNPYDNMPPYYVLSYIIKIK
jgi:microcystin-dependent protein